MNENDTPRGPAARAPIGELGPSTPSAPPQEVNLDLILEVMVTLALEVGRVRMPVRELLRLTPGSIVELSRQANEPLDLLVNGVRVARGELVVVDDKFGVRLTEVVSPAERMERAG
jgi:flagellar motor switch protein FliN/FliY